MYAVIKQGVYMQGFYGVFRTVEEAKKGVENYIRKCKEEYKDKPYQYHDGDGYHHYHIYRLEQNIFIIEALEEICVYRCENDEYLWEGG